MLNPPTFDLDHWTDLLDAREALELLAATRDPEFAAGLLLRRVFYSLKEREAFRAWVLATIRGERMDPRGDALAHRRNIERNRGALLKPRPPAPAPFRDYGDQFRPGYDWTCDGVNQDYIYKLLDTLALRVAFPSSWSCRLAGSTCRGISIGSAITTRMDRALRMLLTRYPNLHIVDGRHSRYVEDFVDPTASRPPRALWPSRRASPRCCLARPSRPIRRRVAGSSCLRPPARGRPWRSGRPGPVDDRGPRAPECVGNERPCWLPTTRVVMIVWDTQISRRDAEKDRGDAEQENG